MSKTKPKSDRSTFTIWMMHQDLERFREHAEQAWPILKSANDNTMIIFLASYAIEQLSKSDAKNLDIPEGCKIRAQIHHPNQNQNQ